MDERDANNQPLPGGLITTKFLRTAAQEALAFTPKLDVWILATTAKRDAASQRQARLLDEEYQSRGRFQILIWFWDDYVSWLNAFPRLQSWYYQDVIQIRNPRDQDRVIIETIATAFHRPAFTASLSGEHFDDFLDALKDTQAALRTGELVDRQSRHVIRKAVGGWRYLEDRDWRTRLKDLDSELSELRGLLVAGVKDGRLQKRHGYLDVKDCALGQRLEEGRARCLSHVNDLLVQAALPTI